MIARGVTPPGTADIRIAGAAARPAVSLRAAQTRPAEEAKAKLERLAHELEGVFLNQLLQVMRQSVPAEGLGGMDSGQEIFTSLFDQSVASLAARRMQRGLGEALYHQLERRLTPEPVADSATRPTTPLTADDAPASSARFHRVEINDRPNPRSCPP